MGRKKRPEPDDKEQSVRFIETAERISIDNAKESFERICDKVIKKKEKMKNDSD